MTECATESAFSSTQEIAHGQRIAAQSVAQVEPTLVVHGPDVVGMGGDGECRPGHLVEARLAARRRGTAMPKEHPGDGAARRQLFDPMHATQQIPQLLRSLGPVLASNEATRSATASSGASRPSPTAFPIARSSNAKASARIASRPFACPPPTSPTARSAWNPCSWRWAKAPRMPPASRSTKTLACKRSAILSSASACSPGGRSCSHKRSGATVEAG